MSEVQHPQADIPPYDFVATERIFAQTALSVLRTFGARVTEYVFEAEKTRFITGRIELIPEEDKVPADVALALRLAETPAFAMSRAVGDNKIWDSNEQLAIELQQGRRVIDDGEEEICDEDFEWEPYVLAVIDSQKPYKPSIVDAQTGKELSGGDLMQATLFLQLLQTKLQAEELDEAMADMGISEGTTTHADFDPDEFINGQECPTCGAMNRCEHPQTWQQN